MGDSHTQPRVLRVGTRGSPLAMTQTRAVIAALEACFPGVRPDAAGPRLEIVVIRTTGDAVQDRRLAEIGGKGLFSKEIHEALLDRRVDLAVHSLKDLETVFPGPIVLACTPAREDPRDALILPAGQDAALGGLAAIAAGGVVGTASMRRQAQILHARPDLSVALLRGNVRTRLERTRAGEFAASILARAGLNRLGLGDQAGTPLAPEVMLPAAGQGIVGITARADDTQVMDMLAAIEHAPTRIAADAERALLGSLDGSCRTPAGAFAEIQDGRVHLRGLVARPDGSFLLRDSADAPIGDAARLGAELGAALRARAPADIFA